MAFDEAHTAHVRRQVVNPVTAIRCLVAVCFLSQIQGEVLRFGEALIPLPLRLDVHSTNAVSLLQ